MTVASTTDPAEFRRRAGELLARDPLRHTVIATAVANSEIGPVDRPPLFISAHADERALGIAIHTPGKGLYISRFPESAITDLAALLHARRAELDIVEGPPECAGAFAQQWSALCGRDFRQVDAVRLYRLGDLRPPRVAGRARRAGAADLELCSGWFERFARELDLTVYPDSAAKSISQGQLWLWEDRSGPVAMAAHKLPALGWSRLGPVYTPPEFRKHGYGAAVTAHVSTVLRENGTEACLFADVANPTSNKIYREIGFRPVSDFVLYGAAAAG
ncbi:MAG: GNAT family N-acetyltransferase [Nocardia sp.]|nr:GNAT family N-acetyltransferase [Nocardia sp.]